jgi:hypothetical protein
MSAGQPVEIEVDATGKTYHGKVTQIGGATGSVLSLFPPENATGNYVKVVQRVPVRIDFTDLAGEDPNHLLRPGLSVEPKVRVKWRLDGEELYVADACGSEAGRHGGCVEAQALAGFRRIDEAAEDGLPVVREHFDRVLVHDDLEVDRTELRMLEPCDHARGEVGGPVGFAGAGAIEKEQALLSVHADQGLFLSGCVGIGRAAAQDGRLLRRLRRVEGRSGLR